MFLLFIASFLFGLANPVGALLVENEDALIFSFQFLGILTLIQLPFVVLKWREIRALKFKGEFVLLLISGLIGTFLYWCEFSSLQTGLPISHITFLSLTVPAWSLLYEYLRGRGTKWDINKWACAIIGSFFLIAPNEHGAFTSHYLLPIFTSILSALWLIYSKKSQEAGLSPIVCSFFNDFFSLIGVLCFILLRGRQEAIAVPTNTVNMVLYCSLIGLLPNILLFYGLRTAGVVAASTIIMLEPFFSGAVSVVLHNDSLGINFLVGAVFIMLSMIPKNLVPTLKRMRYLYISNLFK